MSKMADKRDEDEDTESVEVSLPETAKDWFTPGERRQTNVRVLEYLRTEKDRPKTRQELLNQMKRFCYILTRVQWRALLALLADLKVITVVDEDSKKMEWSVRILKETEIPEQNELGAVYHNCKKLILAMVQSKEELPSRGPDIKALLEPLCDVRHEIEPEEILHELVMTEFVEIKDNTVHYNDAKLHHKETNWYAVVAMIVLLLSVSAALLEAMGRRSMPM